ncbi:3-isopropylmalate dehydratase large subunit [Candidatus Woesearchaeota archaeon]|nr:3-isopropylmalate dehydratase large subunit [Candidatus Woesearchaeota archaeon]
MAERTLLDNVWRLHKIGDPLPSGEDHIYVTGQPFHEVTSAPAFEELRENGIPIRSPDKHAAVTDHVIPTTTEGRKRPLAKEKDEIMMAELEKNTLENKIQYFAPGSGKQGVCHVVFPEMGMIWPGTIWIMGDSHTSTYGAFGAVAFGVGTTEAGFGMGADSTSMTKPKVRRIDYVGNIQPGVSAKDITLYTIRELGLKAGLKHAHELGGPVIENMDMEARLTMCNMGVEINARLCYINPDKVTYDFLKGRPFAPKRDMDKLIEYADSIKSAHDAVYDDRVTIDVSKVEPMLSWGITPDFSVGISEKTPYRKSQFKNGEDPWTILDAYTYMGLAPGTDMREVPVDVVFIGSCTNGRLTDLRAAANILKGRKIAVKTLVVPGSEQVKYDAEQEGLDRIFLEAGAEWREPGCSMCLGMSPDVLVGYQRSCSTSNRPFKGRQGSPTGRTHICSPEMAAATAIDGKFSDPRKYLRGESQ